MLFPVRGKMDINALIIEESDADFNKKGSETEPNYNRSISKATNNFKA